MQLVLHIVASEVQHEATGVALVTMQSLQIFARLSR